MSREASLPKRIYLDSQFCVAYLVANDPDHAAAHELADAMEALSRFGDYFSYVSILTLDEVMWNLAGILHDVDCGPGDWCQITGRKKRTAFIGMTEQLASIVEDFLSESWIKPLPIEEAAYAMLPAVMRGNDLRPADLCHLAPAWASGCGIITNDRDFHSLEEAPVEVVGY
ncbi:MAG: type II toxin-antitoxin system VapC family toxin [Armatimonadota bacterium]